MKQAGDILLNPGPLTYYENITRKLDSYRDIEVLHLNFRSSNSKRTNFKEFVKKIGDKTNFTFSETWFNDSNYEKLWTLDSSKFVCFDLIEPPKSVKFKRRRCNVSCTI